jgi:hypothetical protein
MSYLDANNVKHLLIAKDVDRTANASIDPASADYIADGEIVVCTPDGFVLDATTAATANEIVLYQGRAGSVDGIDQISPVITKADLINGLQFRPFVNDTETVRVVGYDGTAGSIDVINDNLYLLNIDMNESTIFGFGQDKVKYGVYKSDATATQAEIADGLTDSLIANFSREPEKDIVFERLVSDASVALANPANVVNGSDQVSSTAHGLTAGEYVRIGGATTNDPVYKVASVIDANTFTLDVPYQGVSNTAAVAGSIAAPVGDFGIRFTGQPRPFQVGVFNYQKVRFSLTLKDFGATTQTEVSVATEGSGNWEQVAELEWGTQGNEGNYYRSRANAPVDGKRADTVKDENYDMLTIPFLDSKRGHNAIGATSKSRKEIVIVYPNGATGTSIVDATDGIIFILGAFVA